MRCYICDKLMSDAEVHWMPETESFDCCSICLEIALEAANCGHDSDEIDEDAAAGEENEILDVETYRTVFDHCDPSGSFHYSHDIEEE